MNEPQYFDPTPATVEFMYDAVRGHTLRQVDGLDGLSARAYQVLTVASVLVGFATVPGAGGPGAFALLAAVGCSFLAVAALTLLITVPRVFWWESSPKDLWDNRADQSVEELRYGLVWQIVKVSQKNKALHEAKARLLMWATVGLAVETALVSALAAFSVA